MIQKAQAILRCEEERQIKVFDTTLRDGQQCPGAGMDFEQNIEYAAPGVIAQSRYFGSRLSVCQQH